MIFLMPLINAMQQEEFNVTLQQWQALCKKMEKPVNKGKNVEMKEFYLTNKIKDLKVKSGDIALLISVNSRNIIAVGYREEKLYILFNSSDIYSYEDVPLKNVCELIAIAQKGEISLGKYFNAIIKKGGYSYKKLGAFNLKDCKGSSASL